jgi:xanthine dehydrogenase YagR molybdenum-binding subunit
MSIIGTEVRRVDGPKKVSGGAPYVAEFAPRDMTYGVAVQSTIAWGRVSAMDTAEAESVPGVLRVLTPWNSIAPKLPWKQNRQQVDPISGEFERPLASDRVLHQGQHIGLVVAETPEAARHAVSLVRVTYAPDEDRLTDIDHAVLKAGEKIGKGDPVEQEPGKSGRGDPARYFADAPVQIDASYLMERENHAAMEPHATIAEWRGEELTLWDKSQWVQNCAQTIGDAFGMEAEKIHVVCPFIGGAFGSGLRVWPHTFLAAIAAKEVGRPVKIELTRRQCFHEVGARPWTRQRVRLGAERNGHLAALLHEAVAETSAYENNTEATLRPSSVLHRCENVELIYRLAPRAVNTPNAMRAPGETTGLFALESAMDELAYALKLDPLELRLRNIPERDLHKDLPFSTMGSEACLREGAKRFGWKDRPLKAGEMRDGRLLIGQGLASAIYPTMISPATARARLMPDGRVEVTTASSDMGPGTWTSLTQIAADRLGLPVERVKLRIGDSKLPKAPVHGGSMTTASVGSAVHDACLKLIEAVRRERGMNTDDISALSAGLDHPIEAEGSHDPGDLTKRFSCWALGAVFVEVAIDPDTAEVRVRRIVGAYAAGRIVNPLLARSQCIGGLINGIGQALMERTEVDNRTGRVVNANLAEYLVPVLADTPAMEVMFIPEEDPHIGPLGAKGLGEIALCGIGPAIANAVFHAIGHRMRHLPITTDKIAQALYGRG